MKDESDSINEQAFEALSEDWANLSDEDRTREARDQGALKDGSEEIEEPEKYEAFSLKADKDDYQKTKTIARYLQSERTRQIWEERGCDPPFHGDPEKINHNLWEVGLVLVQEQRVVQFSFVRLKNCMGDDLKNERVEHISDSGKTYDKLPDLKLMRNGALSTTAKESVANGWGGCGETPPNPERVVMRIDAPARSVLSLPVYGKNIADEEECVLAGTQWNAWDAWKGKAIDVSKEPIKRSPKIAASTKKPLVIDFNKIEDGQPHWLSKPEKKSKQEKK